jgi:hypothetical protein
MSSRNIDITTMNNPPEIMESVVVIPTITTYDSGSYCVAFLPESASLGKYYGRVYPNCPFADTTKLDDSGDFYCKKMAKGFPCVFHCGCN